MCYWLLAVVAFSGLSTRAAEPTEEGRFLRLFWFEPGVEHGNPTTNRRFRVNDPQAALHPEFGQRLETRGNGMLQIELTEPLARIRSAELALELWGGHPGTSNKRVTVNGRSTYTLPEIGTAAGQCTHQYPVLALQRSDLVQAHNAFQFACDQGDSFWGHFIIDNACLRVELPPEHATLREAGLESFSARIVTEAVSGETIPLRLEVPADLRGRVAGADFQGFYSGYDENGDGRALDWHGMTKARRPYEHLGSSEGEPHRVVWDTRMLPAQREMAARAVVRFVNHPDLVYITPSLTGLQTSPGRDATVQRYASEELPRPFWSRANKLKSCDITLDGDPATVATAELRVVLWDGGAGKIESPLKFNGRPLPFRSDAKHDVKSLRLPIDPMTLVRGHNRFEVLCDTEHHGIEILLPGPELWVRTRAGLVEHRPVVSGVPEASKASPSRDTLDALRRAAMNRSGDVAQGRKLFASETLKCAVCHRVGDAGGEAGPDLSHVAGKLDRTHLIEAVLDPSAQILEGFRTTVVTRTDGRVVSGIVRGESSDGFTLIDADNKKTAIATGEIETRQTSSVSLMPRELVASLSPGQFSDLIAYLETLRTGRKLTPGEGVTGAISLPEGFVAEPLATGLTGGTAIEVAADGRVFVCEQAGALRLIKNENLLDEPFLQLPVAATWERGLIGVTVAPDFPRTPHVYICYVLGQPYPHHVISRWTARGDRAAPDSEIVLFEGDDQTQLGGHKPDGHQGGAVHFGVDGKLYVALGEQTASTPSQRMDSLLGKLLRLNPDGSIPYDNPFADTASGKYRAIWALGLRNPFTFAVSPSGRLFINDVGGVAEEINEGVAGANYGWPTVDHGPTADARFRGPIHHYPTACISGGAFAPRDSTWPAEFRGRYFFADFNHGVIRTLDPEAPAESRLFASGLPRPVDLRFAPDGRLLVLLRNAWVIDNHFQPHTSSLIAIGPHTSR